LDVLAKSITLGLVAEGVAVNVIWSGVMLSGAPIDLLSNSCGEQAAMAQSTIGTKNLDIVFIAIIF
jgi:hypothetical protein